MSPLGGHSSADLRRLAEVGAAALLGGLVAALLLALLPGVDRPEFIAVLIAAMTVFCVMATDALQSAERRHRSSRHSYQQPWPQPSVGSPAGGAFEPPPPPPFASPQPQHTWHLAAARDSAVRGSAPAAISAPPAPPVDLDPEPGPARVAEVRIPGRSGGVRRIVQCPRCAEFDITVAEDAGGFAFGCRGCRHTWRWTPGRPWPPTVARPALAHRGGSRPPA